MSSLVRGAVRGTAVIVLVAASMTPMRAQAPAPASCEPIGEIRFVCGQDGPEDLVTVPGTGWIVASAYGASGGLHLIDTKAGTSTRLFPAARAVDRPDTKAYPSCPGPLQGEDREHFRTHGLYLKAGSRSTHTLYAVHHGTRESVEVFELDVRSTPVAIAWIGCAVAPEPIGLNAVVALPDGGFAATNFDPRPPAGARAGGFSAALTSGQNNGEVWEWHARGGWSKIPGSEAAGANGLEISKDGKWFYVAQWGNRTFMRLSRGQAQPSRQVIELGFRVDNVRWDSDGTLLVAGQGDGGIGGANTTASSSVIGRVDPRTMRYTQIVNQPTSDRLSAATVAVRIGDELWAGSFRGDRVARYPAAGLKARAADRPAAP